MNYDAIYDKALDDLNAKAEENYNSLAMEGATFDALKINIECRKRLKSLKSEMRAAEKSGDYNTAAAKANAAATVAKEMMKTIDSLEPSIGSAAIATIVSFVGAILADICANKLTGGVGTVKGFVKTESVGAVALVATSAAYKVLTKQMRGKKKIDLNANDFNALISALHADLNQMVVTFNRKAAEYKRMAAKGKPAKESFDIIEYVTYSAVI